MAQRAGPQQSAPTAISAVPSTDDFRVFRDRSVRNIQRWLSELAGGPARSTLEVGIASQTCKIAEQLLQRIAQAFVQAAGERGLEAIAEVSNGKKHRVAGLTLGQCVHLLILMDNKRLSPSGRRFISKADKALLERICKQRNTFVHPTPSQRVNVQAIEAILSDVLRLAALPVTHVCMRS
jgi:hypothetical protein